MANLFPKLPLSYSKGNILFHWLIASIVIPMLIFSFFLGDLPRFYSSIGFTIHKSFGISVFVLMLIRLIWLHYTGKPTLPLTVAQWEVYLARIVQWSLYFFILAMALSGWIMVTAAGNPPNFFGLIHLPFPGIDVDKALADLLVILHKRIAWVLIGLIVIHILGALKNHFINKNDVLRSMLPR